MQYGFEHGDDQDGVGHAEPGSERARRKFRQPAFQQIREYASGAKAEQSDRYGEESEVIKEDDREQSSERQFEK